MLENFRLWYLRNHNEITWFLIGFLVMAGCSDLGQGDYPGAILSFAIAWVNYYFNKR